MKLFLHILIFFLFAFNTQAGEYAFENAQILAKKYCQNPTLRKTGLKPSSSSLRSASEREPSYFIFSDDSTNTFCIVSADTKRILGYGDNYSDDLPLQLQEILDMYATSPQHFPELRSSNTRENIPAFMDVVFGTRSPYNKFIPERDGSGPPVGCVPVTLAQIAKYYEHPSKLMNDIPGYSHYSTTSTDTIFQIDGQKAEGRTYDWNLILNHYEKDTTEDLNNEVAKLMWDCARSVETTFAQSGSAALTDMFFYSLIHYFGYNSDSLKKISRRTYYREEWLDIIHEELSKKRPIYMSGTSYNHGGHAFICDGYVDGYLHINWGWNGSCDGYFDVDILDYKHNKDKDQTSPDIGYSFFETIIIGIVPGEGKTEYKKPQSSTSIVQPKQEGINVDTKYRATDKGFVMYTSLETYKQDIDEDRNFTLGYLDKNGKFSFLADGESEYFNSNILIIETKKEFDKSYLGKELKLCILESDKNDVETIVQDTIYEWWNPSELFDTTITITIPDTIVNNDAIIEPKKVNLIGEYTDSTIALNIEFQAEKPEGIMKYFALAIAVDGDTLMSETTKNAFSTKSEESLYIKRALKNLDWDNEISLLVVQADNIPSGKLNKKNWDVCKNFKPITFKLSDCKIFSKELVVDTIVHTTKGTKQSFEITFSNPTPFEYYNDVYFLINNEESTGVMIDIPANGTIKRTIERDMPLFTRYINGLFSIYNNFDVAAEMVFTKDTFSHVFYALNGGDETTLSLQILNGTKKKYTNTFVLVSDTDTIASQTVTVEPLTIAKFDHSLPVIASDTDFIPLDYTPYAFYDNDNNLLGYVSPLDYYGTVYQSVGNRKDKYISIQLRPIIDSIMPPLIIGVTSSLEETDKYQMRQYTPDPAEMSAISIEFKLSNLFSLEKPKYIGLCKEDGTFYAYMELKWEDHNSSPDILSNDIHIIAVDGGIQISSDVDIPTLPIYNVNGSLIKDVELKQNSSLFVPLPKGIYIAGNKKILITS